MSQIFDVNKYMRVDGDQVVINAPGSYSEIAETIMSERHCMCIAWTDGDGTQLDILFAYDALGYGPLQGGAVGGPSTLFVAIMRMGAFGFAMNGMEIYPSYVSEKLNVGGSTALMLSHLLNGVRAAIEDIHVERIKLKQ